MARRMQDDADTAEVWVEKAYAAGGLDYEMLIDFRNLANRWRGQGVELNLLAQLLRDTDFGNGMV